MYLTSYALLRVTFCIIITGFQTKGLTAFVSLSYMFLDKITMLKIWLNLGLNLTVFRAATSWGR